MDNPAEPSPRIDAVFGLLWRSDQPCLSIEDINRAAADGWAGAGSDDNDEALQTIDTLAHHLRSLTDH